MDRRKFETIRQYLIQCAEKRIHRSERWENYLSSSKTSCTI